MEDWNKGHQKATFTTCTHKPGVGLKKNYREAQRSELFSI